MSTINALKLSYFPFPGRAGAIRDTLNIGGIAFEDEQISIEAFRQRRAAGEFPFGGLPVLSFETGGRRYSTAQSNAILRFTGRLAGLYPAEDLLQAVKVDEAMDMGEDINGLIGPSLHEPDETRKMAMRKTLAEESLPYWGGCFERLLIANGSTGYIVGNTLSVADLKLFWIIDWLTSGILDGIPKDLFDVLPTLCAWRSHIAQVREARLSRAA